MRRRRLTANSSSSFPCSPKIMTIKDGHLLIWTEPFAKEVRCTFFWMLAPWTVTDKRNGNGNLSRPARAAELG
jgi:hypothetical protein